MSPYHQHYANDGSLEQYATNFQGGILEAHANAFDHYAPQHQLPRQRNHGHAAVLPPHQSSYPVHDPGAASHHRSARPVVVAHRDHHHPHSTVINPDASTYNAYPAVPQTTSHHRKSTSTSTSTATVNHHIGLPSPPSSAGHPSPEQPRHASLPYVCCGRSYGSKYTFTRHRRESRTCPHGSGGRRFVCYICANTDQPFSRRASLKQHVQEVHRRSPEEANVEVDTWYGRYGDEKDYPDAMRGLE
ncbi:uncharacterized protein LTHEOB_196 [Lasiodiplodia theobromae]|uniref:uncharacterized protein n=1 Tax=Lasiodiplodia theobromae TaxID=45133 RepID=UPI0015C38F77|nr:uncharacterized protein LTHEOB_196 [Lasiodiplodia theobromae]KAF4543497.1 hypothetical protein LTHEOB_196 [Lasiodiplodia theobromae]